MLLAAVTGRAFFIALVAVFESVSSLTIAAVWQQVQQGFIGLILQAVAVPAVVIALRAAMHRE